MRILGNLPRLVAGALILLLGIAQPAQAGVFCVNTAVALQNALIGAAANGQDDEIRVVQGTYVGNFVYASTETQALAVLGGYTVGCAGRTLDPANTILDGNQTDRVLALSVPDVAAEFLVEGLTLRNGNRLSGGGGGLYAQVGDGGAVTVNLNHIENNRAGGDGGGAFISASYGTATLTNNSIRGNTTIDGGGWGHGNGGGAFISAGTAILTYNSITDNTASCAGGGNGGGVYISATAAATLTNNSITGNTTYDYYGHSSGGGAYISAAAATLTNNSITGNTTSHYYDFGARDGGGLYITSTIITLTNNSITDNTTSGDGGGAYLISNHAFTLTNNSITGNTTGNNGGGAYIRTIIGTLTNNTLAGNTARMGGGLRLTPGNTENTDMASLYNNLFRDNIANENQGADLWIDNDADSDYLLTPVTLLANNFDQAKPSGFSSTLPITIDPSNLNKIDPLFVDASTGDFHLQPGSPMIDAGYPATPDLPEFDIEGTPRVLGNAVDIGAYEFDDGSDPKAMLSIARAGNGSGQVTSSPTGINCGADCFQAYDVDTLVTLTATPTDANSFFAGWSGAADCADGQVTMTTNLSCTATFNAVRRLTVTRAGLGKGRVTSAPAGIDCGAACQAPFPLDTTVTLTATPDASSTFAGWSGDATCPSPKLDVNRSCKATFNPKLFRLYTFVVGTGGGTVTSTPAGINCGTDCEQDYVANTLVTLTAAPNARSNFAGWAGPCTGTALTCQVTLSQVRGVAAIFNLKTHTLSVSKLGNGAVTSAPDGISCGTFCRDKFEDGTRVTLTAVPAGGSGFVNWGGACTGTGRVCTVTLNGAKNVTATFVPLKIAISDVTQSEGNSGTGLFNFTVRLNASTPRTVKVNFATRNGTAQAGADYTARTGLVTFTADQRAKPLGIAVRGDTVKEGNETFFVNLTTPVGATFAKQQGKGTITNDD